MGHQVRLADEGFRSRLRESLKRNSQRPKPCASKRVGSPKMVQRELPEYNWNRTYQHIVEFCAKK